MFFILSKTISILVMPLTLLAIVLWASVLVRNQIWKKRLRWITVALFFFFTNDFLANEVMKLWEIKTIPYAHLKQYDVGIVLTGSTVPFLQPEDRVYFSRGADRVTHTVELYKLGKIKKILISGGSGRLSGEDEPEANKFQRAMIMMGVEAEDIWIENETRNTHESAVAVKPMMDTLGISPENCLLITSAFHMRRSLACYEKAGVDLQPFSTDFYTHPTRYSINSLLLPSMDALGNWQKLIKEWVGMIMYKLMGYI